MVTITVENRRRIQKVPSYPRARSRSGFDQLGTQCVVLGVANVDCFLLVVGGHVTCCVGQRGTQAHKMLKVLSPSIKASAVGVVQLVGVVKEDWVVDSWNRLVFLVQMQQVLLVDITGIGLS